MITQKYCGGNMLSIQIKSVKSFHPCKSVIQTIYDIVTNGHSGTIECVSIEGEGSEFNIKLPIV